MKRKFGYTLAEILIAMGVIGVISMLTVPNIMQSSAEKETYARLASAYASLANISKAIEAKNGRPTLWDYNNLYQNELKKYLNIQCEGQNCYEFTGEKYYWKNTNRINFVTEDGNHWAYRHSVNGVCNYDEGTYIKKGCAWFNIDINGSKGPNKIGKDLFGFVLTSSGVYPMGGCPGCDDTACLSSGGTMYNDLACTATILQHGKIPDSYK